MDFLYFRYMDFDQHIARIIERAEQEIAELAAKAAGARDYCRATSLLAIAQRVADAAKPAEVARALLPQAVAYQHDSVHRHSGAPAPADTNGSHDTAGPAARQKAHSSYPRFKREDDTLVKIGWSKSDRATYEHRSPRSILQNLVQRIAEVGGNGLRFTTEQLLPLLDENGSELPSYQCYLCLAWLVAEGLIERHGRQGYTLHGQGDLSEAVEAAWQALPKR